MYVGTHASHTSPLTGSSSEGCCCTTAVVADLGSTIVPASLDVVRNGEEKGEGMGLLERSAERA